MKANSLKFPYEDKGQIQWRPINHASFDLNGTTTGIVDEINGQRPGEDSSSHPPYNVIHFRDDEDTDVFDGVDSSKYHGMFQIINKLRSRVAGNIPLAKGMRIPNLKTSRLLCIEVCPRP